MIEKKMYCECCGKEFLLEYYRGGYIDHVNNFYGNRHHCGKDVKEDIRHICYDGNEIRDWYDIQERLKCYRLWNINGAVKHEVIKQSEALCEEIRNAENKIRKILSELTSVEKKVLKSKFY